MGTHYRHLTEADRIKIDVMRMEKRSLGFIAQAIGFSKSTISREIQRAAIGGCDRYFAFSGQRRYRTKRKLAGLVRRRLTADTGSPLWRTVIRGLREDLSPEEVAGRLKLIGHEHQVSHETIYLGIGARQGSCRVIQAAISDISTAGELMVTTASRSGLSVTGPRGDQSRVEPDHRAGLASRARMYSAWRAARMA